MTVETFTQYEMEAGIPFFQSNVQTASGKKRLGIRSKVKRQNKTEFIRVESLVRQDREDRPSTARTNKNDPDYQIVRHFVLIHTTVPSWYK
jgi:hypothetical protein